MSVGGKIIEIATVRLPEVGDAVRLWCFDAACGEEVAVHVAPFSEGPVVGDEVWWQSGRVLFDGDRRWLTKIGNSFDPREPSEGGRR